MEFLRLQTKEGTGAGIKSTIGKKTANQDFLHRRQIKPQVRGDQGSGNEAEAGMPVPSDDHPKVGGHRI